MNRNLQITHPFVISDLLGGYCGFVNRCGQLKKHFDWPANPNFPQKIVVYFFNAAKAASGALHRKYMAPPR